MHRYRKIFLFQSSKITIAEKILNCFNICFKYLKWIVAFLEIFLLVSYKHSYYIKEDFLHKIYEEYRFYEAMASCKGITFSPSLSGGLIVKPLAFKKLEKRPPLSINS